VAEQLLASQGLSFMYFVTYGNNNDHNDDDVEYDNGNNKNKKLIMIIIIITKIVITSRQSESRLDFVFVLTTNNSLTYTAEEWTSYHRKHSFPYCCVSSVFTEALLGNGLRNPAVTVITA
jgi:hypothetical protein